jgi:hypothetical protein
VGAVRKRKVNAMSKIGNEIEVDVRVGTEQEIAVDVSADDRSVSQLFATIAVSDTRVLASKHYNDGRVTMILLVSENAVETMRTLDSAGFEYESTPVVLVASRCGLGFAAQLGACLRGAAIGILYSYASQSASDTRYIVFKTTDDDQAVRVLKDCAWDTAILREASTPRAVGRTAGVSAQISP